MKRSSSGSSSVSHHWTWDPNSFARNPAYAPSASAVTWLVKPPRLSSVKVFELESYAAGLSTQLGNV